MIANDPTEKMKLLSPFMSPGEPGSIEANGSFVCERVALVGRRTDGGLSVNVQHCMDGERSQGQLKEGYKGWITARVIYVKRLAEAPDLACSFDISFRPGAISFSE